jgi:hypothetical protein
MDPDKPIFKTSFIPFQRHGYSTPGTPPPASKPVGGPKGDAAKAGQRVPPAGAKENPP